MRSEALTQLDAVIRRDDLPESVRRELQAAAHKLRFPMTDILAKIHAESLSERARQIGVSRQTMYVWAAERFRPSGEQAIRIAELTAVPIEHIVDKYYDPKRTTRPSSRQVARRRKRASRHNGETERGKRRVVAS